MTDADKLERIRSIVRDHDAYGMSRHHEMVLDLTDVLAPKEGGADIYDPKTRRVLAHPAQKLAVKAFQAELAERGQLAIGLLEMALALPDEVLHAPITFAEKLYPLCDHIQRYQRACQGAR